MESHLIRVSQMPPLENLISLTEKLSDLLQADKKSFDIAFKNLATAISTNRLSGSPAYEPQASSAPPVKEYSITPEAAPLAAPEAAPAKAPIPKREIEPPNLMEDLPDEGMLEPDILDILPPDELALPPHPDHPDHPDLPDHLDRLDHLDEAADDFEPIHPASHFGDRPFPLLDEIPFDDDPLPQKKETPSPASLTDPPIIAPQKKSQAKTDKAARLPEPVESLIEDPKKAAEKEDGLSAKTPHGPGESLKAWQSYEPEPFVPEENEEKTLAYDDNFDDSLPSKTETHATFKDKSDALNASENAPPSLPDDLRGDQDAAPEVVKEDDEDAEDEYLRELEASQADEDSANNYFGLPPQEEENNENSGAHLFRVSSESAEVLLERLMETSEVKELIGNLSGKFVRYLHTTIEIPSGNGYLRDADEPDNYFDDDDDENSFYDYRDDDDDDD
jgi:hypothetical protein